MAESHFISSQGDALGNGGALSIVLLTSIPTLLLPSALQAAPCQRALQTEKKDFNHLTDTTRILKIKIPGKPGKTLPGEIACPRLINELSCDIDSHVLTADTFGSVKKELTNINCKVVIIPINNQDISKLDYVLNLEKEKTLCVGNGRNGRLMRKESIIGIVVIQQEGVCVESLIATDIASQSIVDVFEFFKSPNRLKATLRN